MEIFVCNLGRMDYAKTLEIQLALHELRKNMLILDTLILVEHEPVITIGRSGKQENIIVPADYLRKQGVSVYEVTRGGDVTYHGPGQIVGYPIFDLNNYGKDIKLFIRNIENIFIELLKNEFCIEAHYDEKKYTGVWVGDEKITAIGIAVKQWVTMHGFAFNVNTNLEHFKWIVPCGISDKGVASLEKLLGKKQDFEKMNQIVVQYLAKIFNVKPTWKKVQDILGKVENKCTNRSRNG